MWRKVPPASWVLLAMVFLGGTAARLISSEGIRAASESEGRPVAFRVDTEASRVYVKVGTTAWYGHGHGVEGRLSSGTVALGGPGELVVDLRSLAADTPGARRYVGLSGTVSEADRREAEATLQGARVLDILRHPRATYTIASARPRDGQAPGAPGFYRLTGQLLLHGVVRRLPLLALAEPTETPGVLRLRGSISVLQSDFGITPFSALGGRLRVADRLDIWADLVLRPAP